MIEDENHPRMQTALVGLKARLAIVGTGRLDKYHMDKVMSVVREHRQEWRGRGVAFPPLTALINVQTGQVDLVRADMDRKGIQITVRNFIVKNPNLTPFEIAGAVRMAWPDLPNGWLLDTSEDYSEKTQNSIERQLSGEKPLDPQVAEMNRLVKQAIEFDPSLREHFPEEVK